VNRGLLEYFEIWARFKADVSTVIMMHDARWRVGTSHHRVPSRPRGRRLPGAQTTAQHSEPVEATSVVCQQLNAYLF
jgi:hypothetical protein